MIDEQRQAQSSFNIAEVISKLLCFQRRLGVQYRALGRHGFENGSLGSESR